MKVVIDIPEEQYITLNAKSQEEVLTVIDISLLIKAIKNGTPLPKGHGDLIDRKDLIENGISKGFCDWYDEIKMADKIIEADGGKCGMSDKQKLEKIRRTLDSLDKEVADKEVTRDYWDGFCKVFNAVEVAMNENSK